MNFLDSGLSSVDVPSWTTKTLTSRPCPRNKVKNQTNVLHSQIFLDTVEALKKQYQQLLQHRQQIQQVLEAEEQERSEYTRQNQEYTQQRDSLKQKLTIIIRETELMEVEIMKESRSTSVCRTNKDIHGFFSFGGEESN